jgi:hypothetical protein
MAYLTLSSRIFGKLQSGKALPYAWEWQGPLTLPCLHRDQHAREAQEHALSQELMQQAPASTYSNVEPGLWWVGTASLAQPLGY